MTKLVNIDATFASPSDVFPESWDYYYLEDSAQMSAADSAKMARIIQYYDEHGILPLFHAYDDKVKWAVIDIGSWHISGGMERHEDTGARAQADHRDMIHGVQ